MKAITLRDVPPRIARKIERKARENRTSLNRAVIALLEEGNASTRLKSSGKARDLGFIAGSWTMQDARAFDACLSEQRKIDPELWK